MKNLLIGLGGCLGVGIVYATIMTALPHPAPSWLIALGAVGLGIYIMTLAYKK